MGSKFKLALIQLSVGANKSDNLIRAANKISEAVEKGANIVSLPGSKEGFVVPQMIPFCLQNVSTLPTAHNTSRNILSLFQLGLALRH